MLNNKFDLHSPFKPAGDQPQAIAKLIELIKQGNRNQVLLGITGSGKTYSMANVIAELNRPTLIITHNKTLTAQLASEFEEFFPNNAVHYFVSYYDYYQPEAYLPRTDTYIEKETDINEEIDRLRNAATQALLTRRDVIIVASVSCIYGLGNPADYLELSMFLKIGQSIKREKILRRLVDLRYHRNDLEIRRGTYRVRGDVLEINLSSEQQALKISFYGDEIDNIETIDTLTGRVISKLKETIIFPAKHFVTTDDKMDKAHDGIKQELETQIAFLEKNGKLLEAQRIKQRTEFDLEMIKETGYVNGIENYSRHIDGRTPGSPPGTLIDYFPDDILLFIDESHQTVPQIKGMYEGDRSRKTTLIEYGFRLPSALDNRPLKFQEFLEKTNQITYVSATPGPYELRMAYEENSNPPSAIGGGGRNSKLKSPPEYSPEMPLAQIIQYCPAIVQQVIRPTGLVDPKISIKPINGQVDSATEEIKKRIAANERVLVTTLTKRMAEELSEYLADLNIKVHHLHSEIITLERLEILRDLRAGVYDVVVGINLLREGLDLPEVSLVLILDADKEGFLRSETSLIQTMGRAARHINGQVIMYADRVTGSMQRAIAETQRRRQIQEAYNKKHGIMPKGIVKSIRESRLSGAKPAGQILEEAGGEVDLSRMNMLEMRNYIAELTDQMELAADNFEFERAAMLRDRIKQLNELKKMKKH
ncbi:MAG: excinuclease ABC subunit B, partial [Candidatus Doudnabacteria bacterium RIFCSPHIGHO2_02_FULL_46_11]